MVHDGSSSKEDKQARESSKETYSGMSVITCGLDIRDSIG